MNQAIIPLFFDNHIVVCNKPNGLLTEASGTTQDSLEEQAKQWVKIKYNKPGNVFLTPIHRIDKPVSGIVVFAKNSKALTRLNRLIQDKQTRKIYWAWVEGLVTADEAELEHFVFHDQFYARIVQPSLPQAKLARLRYRTLARQSQHNRSLLEIQLFTGRYHQIRVQLAAIGHPVLGDVKYGSQQRYYTNAIALHHKILQMKHPVSQAECLFEAPLPANFAQCEFII